MKKRNMAGIVFSILIFGGLAVFSFFNVKELIILKYSHELVNGNIESIDYQ
jgi:hypothetical protein